MRHFGAGCGCVGTASGATLGSVRVALLDLDGRPHSGLLYGGLRADKDQQYLSTCKVEARRRSRCAERAACRHEDRDALVQALQPVVSLVTTPERIGGHGQT